MPGPSPASHFLMRHIFLHRLHRLKATLESGWPFFGLTCSSVICVSCSLPSLWSAPAIFRKPFLPRCYIMIGCLVWRAGMPRNRMTCLCCYQGASSCAAYCITWRCRWNGAGNFAALTWCSLVLVSCSSVTCGAPPSDGTVAKWTCGRCGARKRVAQLLTHVCACMHLCQHVLLDTVCLLMYVCSTLRLSESKCQFLFPRYCPTGLNQHSAAQRALCSFHSCPTAHAEQPPSVPARALDEASAARTGRFGGGRGGAVAGGGVVVASCHC